MKTYKIGILGTGGIAEKMAITLGGMIGIKRYAVASRTQDKAEAFARTWHFEKHTAHTKHWLMTRMWT